jgi:hypothetical protein
MVDSTRWFARKKRTAKARIGLRLYPHKLTRPRIKRKTMEGTVVAGTNKDVET